MVDGINDPMDMSLGNSGDGEDCEALSVCSPCVSSLSVAVSGMAELDNLATEQRQILQKKLEQRKV